MALNIGSKAPDFTLPCTNGTDFSLYQDMKGKSCVIYIYPKDFTEGCTKEACSFRDSFERFRNLNISIFGISKDDMETHHKFKKEHNLPFELLTDKDGSVCKKYDALIPILGLPMRVTYLIDENQTIIGCYDSMFDAFGHIQKIIQQAEKR
jgi:peroxiredoxin Q/BCP